jgi:hypothetical protein
MCEILIFAGNNTHPDPVKDRRGCWKRGYPVMVKEDGEQWGAAEGLPKFVIIKIPGVPAKKAEAFLDVQMEDDAGVPVYENVIEVPLRRGVYRRKAWRVVWASLPQGIQDTLQSTGEITVTVNQIRNYLRRIRDDAVFTGLD